MMAGPFSQKSLQAPNRSSIGKISGEKETRRTLYARQA
jgi:hypothetical protein